MYLTAGKNGTRTFPIHVFIYININTPKIQLTTWGHDHDDYDVCLPRKSVSRSI